MGGSVLVSVVVALGTEPVLVSRSKGSSCVSGEGAWATMAGIEGDDASVGTEAAALTPHSVESTGSDTDWMVVVAGVSVGGSAAGEASPWSSARGAAKRVPPSRWASGVSTRLRGDRKSAAASGIVDWICFIGLQVNAWSLCTRVESGGRDGGDAVERCAGCCTSSLARRLVLPRQLVHRRIVAQTAAGGRARLHLVAPPKPAARVVFVQIFSNVCSGHAVATSVVLTTVLRAARAGQLPPKRVSSVRKSAFFAMCGLHWIGSRVDRGCITASSLSYVHQCVS